MGVGAVEAAQYNLQESLSGRGAGFQQRDAGHSHSLEDEFQRGGVEVFFALEVVIEQRFVDSCFLGNLLSARAGKAVIAELANSSGKNAGTSLVGALGLGARWSRDSHI